MKPTVALALLTLLCACGTKGGLPPERLADAVHAVVEADRGAYARHVVDRLMNTEKVLKATEHWKDEKTLPLPAQMMRMGATAVNEKDIGVSYTLQSLWPLNKQNAPRTDAERAGLKAVLDDPKKPYYARETLGGKEWLTAAYADVAVTSACIQCHNHHRETPKKDFKVGEVMGAVVVRVALDR